MTQPVLIVGGGLAGLCCAKRLIAAGRSVVLCEAGMTVGGRVQTERVDGFLLDRGFQVLLTAYPESQRQLDYAGLELHRFLPGAIVRAKGQWHRFVDPWRRPQAALATALSRVGTLGDKFRVAKFKRSTCSGSLEALYERPETTAAQRLKDEWNFSEQMLTRFLRPFLGGIFLESELTTSSRMLEFVFRMFALGDAALPATGMQAIPQQLASSLPTDALRLETPVASVTDKTIRLATGEELSGSAVVVATAARAAAELLGETPPPPGRQVGCLYYAAAQPPLSEPILVLNGEGTGPVNNLCVPSQVVPGYAPAGQSLISVSVLEDQLAQRTDEQLEQAVRKQLTEWYGSQVASWKLLRQYRIQEALPDAKPPALSPVAKPTRHPSGVFACGDWCDTGSIQGAMISGRRAAEAILEQA